MTAWQTSEKYRVVQRNVLGRILHIKSFNELSLSITIQANLRIVNFLGLTFNLSSGKYYPYRKPNDKPLYINRLSNHPLSILQQLPVAISRRLTNISHDVDDFRDAAPLYNKASTQG